ncbi:hypothetical protein GRI62_01690 [Erythrobacter arachoides]|uniref:Beta-carotene 15,15'-dioxygenase n=1 Tax=Aurantiacibacter arachoides TaxID=1850444 RepID=A0A844ZX53_9SPHN|nr:Brp/Blh family beta-carotene 15,15'-dioxygenase [Aurantiacibacter arachoides]MXO92318.1 hypothetical protein [Aurantiacibacter arachoides]GGD58113.1 hypothetical protein GCM10011411_17730 [Aurantiacibacter arachoides]
MTAATAAVKRRSVPWGRAVLPFIFVCALAAQIAGEGAAIVLGLAFFLAGTAHGAGDEQGGAIRPWSAVGAAGYVVAGLAVAALFVAAPLAGLSLFLLLSAWHFARSTGGTRARQLAFALTAVGGSALWQVEGTGAIFAAVVGTHIPAIWMTGLAMLGGAGLLLAALALSKRWRDPLLWSVLAATALLHPVLAVGYAFLAGHALPLQEGQFRRHGWRQVLAAQGPTTALAVLGAAAIAALVLTGNLALPLAAALAFGMAAPHMLSERLER